MIVGRNFLVKINANIGTAPLPPRSKKSRKIRLGLPLGSRYDYGLIYGENIHETGNGLSATLLPIGTVPIYQEKVNGIAEDLTWEIFRDTLIEQEQGVSYFTIHAGVLLRYIHLTAERVTGILVADPSWQSGVCFITKKTSFIPILKTFAKY
jgi:phosphomethylpyrimidine synthase